MNTFPGCVACAHLLCVSAIFLVCQSSVFTDQAHQQSYHANLFTFINRVLILGLLSVKVDTSLHLLSRTVAGTPQPSPVSGLWP